jgi:hypothetical protein
MAAIYQFTCTRCHQPGQNTPGLCKNCAIGLKEVPKYLHIEENRKEKYFKETFEKFLFRRRTCSVWIST